MSKNGFELEWVKRPLCYVTSTLVRNQKPRSKASKAFECEMKEVKKKRSD